MCIVSTFLQIASSIVNFLGTSANTFRHFFNFTVVVLIAFHADLSQPFLLIPPLGQRFCNLGKKNDFAAYHNNIAAEVEPII